MKVYVAGKFEEKIRVREVQAALLAQGHTITHDWTTAEEYDGATFDHFAVHAEADGYGVMTSDVVVVIPHDRGKGLYVEMGMALATGKHVLVMCESRDQKPSCIFEFLPQVMSVCGVDEVCTMVKAIQAFTIQQRASFDDVGVRPIRPTP